MTRVLMAATAAYLLTCGFASAQVGGTGPSPLGTTSPLGMTSPLGTGPAAPVPPTGIPLGTTELGSVGVSPTTSGTSPLSPPTTSSTATCAGINSTAGNLSGGSSTGASSPASGSLFDGGSLAGTASGTCAGIATGPTGGPASSASSPTGMGSTSPNGRVGIPMGSTELGVGGVSRRPLRPLIRRRPFRHLGARPHAPRPECQRLPAPAERHLKHRAGRRCDARLSFPPLC
jgi:hypothetical protein